MFLRMPCDERMLCELVAEGVAEAAERGIRVDAEELTRKARSALSQACVDEDPLTDMELAAVLSTYVSNRAATASG